MPDFDTEQEWLDDRHDQWVKFRRGNKADEETLASRGSLLEHPDIDEVPYESRGWEVAHGIYGPRKRISFLVRRRGEHYETIHPPIRAAWSKDGPDTQWTLTQEGEGPVYRRKAGSLLDAVRMSDTPPGQQNRVSEEPFNNNPDASEGSYERSRFRDLRDSGIWDIKPFGRRSRESAHRPVGAVSRASDTVWG